VHCSPSIINLDCPFLNPFLESRLSLYNLPLEEEWTTIFSLETCKLINTRTLLVPNNIMWFVIIKTKPESAAWANILKAGCPRFWFWEWTKASYREDSDLSLELVLSILNASCSQMAFSQSTVTYSRSWSDWACCSFICSFKSVSICRRWPLCCCGGWTLVISPWGEEELEFYVECSWILDGERVMPQRLWWPYFSMLHHWQLTFLGPWLIWKRLFEEGVLNF